MIVTENFRYIAKLEVKNGKIIKGLQFEGLRALGSAAEFAEKYNFGDLDELLLIDPVASLYDRSSMLEELKLIAPTAWIPVTAGGGIRSVRDAEIALKYGADKIFVNTAALRNPNLIRDIAREFGSQAVILSIEARKVQENFFCYCNHGRDRSNWALNDWIDHAMGLGPGELLITSIDKDGMEAGPDLELVDKLPFVDIPVLYSGGIRNFADIKTLLSAYPFSGVAIASAFHYSRASSRQLKLEHNESLKQGVEPTMFFAQEDSS